MIWYLEGNQSKLSSHAIHLIDSVIAQGGTLYIPSICIVELIYLTERKRIHDEFLTKLKGELTKPSSVFVVSSLNQIITYDEKISKVDAIVCLR